MSTLSSSNINNMAAAAADDKKRKVGGGGGKKENGANKKQKSKKKQPAPIAVAPDGGEVYEAENVLGARKSRNGNWEYRVRWKGYSAKDDTWEPVTNLYGPLFNLALSLKREKEQASSKKKKEIPLGIKEEEAKAPVVKNVDYSDIFMEELDQESYPVEPVVEKKRAKGVAKEKKVELPDLWEWNDKGQVKFRDIERINVNDEGAARRVREARESGVPVCLVGHTGWVNFARRWLKRKDARDARSEWRDQEDEVKTITGPDMSWAHKNGKSNKGCKVLCIDAVKKPCLHDGDNDGKTASTAINLDPTLTPLLDAKPVSENAKPVAEGKAANDSNSNEGNNAKTLLAPPRGGDDLAITDSNANNMSAEPTDSNANKDCAEPTNSNANNNTSSAEPADRAGVSSGGEIKKKIARPPEVSDASSFEMSPTPAEPANKPQNIAEGSFSHDGAAAGDKLRVAETSIELDTQNGGSLNDNQGMDNTASTEADSQIDMALEPSSQVLHVKTIATKDATGDISRANETVETQDAEKLDSTMVRENNAASATTSDGWLDLTEEWEIDVNKMTEDLGTEMVPVLRPKYNEQKPINGQVPLAEFLKRCWPSQGSTRTPQRLYLHQWQFPLSPQVAEKLCGPDCHNPLPHDILGEDLLKWWQDSNNNPYQYIFMGRDDTISKLHRDAGGLAISIAPVVGEKEVVLVHRADGYSCLSHLQASLEKIDLNTYPLVSQARIYKSVIKPGEILLMPQGTFHQCRNVTPCLSYSKFYLDTVNLRAFLESCMNGDAPEISHEEVLWNCSHELSKQVDQYTDTVKANRKNGTNETSVPPDIVRKVDALRSLRCILRAIYLRFESGDRVAAGEGDGEVETTCQEEADRWATLLGDLDATLHEFRYRRSSKKPPMRSQRPKSPTFMQTDLERDLESCPKVTDSDTCQETDNPSVGSKVEVSWNGRIVKGEVLGIESAMKAAFCHFEALPEVYDEFLRFETLRVPVSGEVCVDMLPEEVKPGKIIVYPYGTEEYRAVIRARVEDTFFRLCLTAGPGTYTRWLPRKAILRCKA